MDALRQVLSQPAVLFTWLAIAAISEGILIADLKRHDTHLAPLMKGVWVLTVLYSGPIGLAVYYFSGRRQIGQDSIWRKGLGDRDRDRPLHRAASHANGTAVLVFPDLFSVCRPGRGLSGQCPVGTPGR